MAKEIGKELAKTLEMRPLREYNISVGFFQRKPLIFHKLQHHANVVATRRLATQARLRAWLPLLAVQVQVLSPAP
jgi:hypothetical protein